MERQDRWNRARRRAAAGAAGLTALAGVGALVITNQAGRTENIDASAIRPPATFHTPLSPGRVPSNSRPSEAAQAAAVTPAPTRSLTAEQRDMLQKVRAAASKSKRPVLRALTPAPGMRVTSDVQERSVPVNNGSLRIITSRSDLRGQRELLWPADAGKKYGDITCTQNFRFATNAKPAIRRTLLLCWRISAKRSVVTVLVDFGGRPSVGKSADVIEREWARLA